MKKLGKIITMSFISLLAGVLAVSPFIKASDVKETKADIAQISGLYRKVTDLSELKAGDNIILYVDWLGGLQNDIGYANPAWFSFEKTNISQSQDAKHQHVYSTGSPVATFELVDGGATNTYYFKTNIRVYGKDYNGHYLAYNPSDNVSGTYTSVGYFYNHTGLLPNKENNSKFTLSYDSSSDQMSIRNVGTGNLLSVANYGSDPTITANGGSNDFQIYKQFDGSIMNIEVLRNPDHSAYYPGETIDYTGLKVEVSYTMDDYEEVNYADHPEIFDAWGTTVRADETDYILMFAGMRNVTVTLTVLENPYDRYTKVTSLFGDFRGTYLLIIDKGASSKYIATNQFTGNYYDTDIFLKDINAYGGRADRTSFTMAGEIKIERHNYNDASRYYALSGDGKYFHGCDDNYYNDWFLGTTETIDDVNEIRFETIEDNVVMRVGNFAYDRVLLYDSFTAVYFHEKDKNYQDYVSLYKLDMTSETQNEINSFVSSFHSTIKEKCNSSGGNTITQDDWEDMEEAFLGKGVDAQGHFANLAYNHNAESDYTDKDTIDLYDYLVARYDFKDFMNRKEANTFEDHSLSNYSVFPITNSDNISIIVTLSVVGIISVVSIVLFIRKRRNNAYGK